MNRSSGAKTEAVGSAGPASPANVDRSSLDAAVKLRPMWTAPIDSMTRTRGRGVAVGGVVVGAVAAFLMGKKKWVLNFFPRFAISNISTYPS